jgi:hypothetical protein
MPERRVVKKLILLLLILAISACSRSRTPAPGAPPPSAPANQVGGADPRAALSAFLAAAKAQNIVAMSAMWGGPGGLARDGQPWADVEKRLITMACYLRHDSSTVLRENAVAGGGRTFTVQLTAGDITRASDFTTVAGSGGRWYLQDFQIEPLTALCSRR